MDPLRHTFLWHVTTPFDARVGDTEALALRIALRVRTGLGNHHGKVAALLPGKTQAGFEQCALQSAPAQFRHRRGAGKQSHALVNHQGARRTRQTIALGQEAYAALAADNQFPIVRTKSSNSGCSCVQPRVLTSVHTAQSSGAMTRTKTFPSPTGPGLSIDRKSTLLTSMGR